MPLPKPTKSETEREFINRCMSDDESVKEFPEDKQRVAVCYSQWRGREFKETNSDKVTKKTETALKNKLKEHKEKVGNDKRKQTTLRKLKIVYNRGVGAYRTNPSSVRPTVTSPEQWAMGRVNSFLRALRNLRYKSGKHDTDLLPKEHPLSGDKKKKADEHRRYEDGEPIPSELPPKYRKSRSDGETKGQACINCKFYEEDFKQGEEEHRFYCTHWEAPIRPQYWCAAWKASEKAGGLDSEQVETEFAETYNDYPQSATENAKKVLRWRDEHSDEIKGMTAVGWRRANQLAKREKISRETIARMASFKRHQKNADIDPKFKSTPWKDAGYVAWLGWGGTSGVEWAIRKLKQIDKRAASSMEKNFAFNSFGIEQTQVDRDSGTMSGVALISVGPALGHGLFVDQESVDGIMEVLEEEKLPAYITHKGALFEDRLTREIGMFENFRIKDDRLLGDFQAFESFREDDTRKFNRLFEMAEKMPERFGLSIVFTADSVWATPEGDVDTLEKPEDATFEFPSIRVEEVSSADFVDSPAANQRGLFSKIDNPKSIKMTKAQLSEKVEELASEKEEMATQIIELESALDEHEEKDEAMDALALEKAALEAEVESLKLQLEEAEAKIAEIKEKLGGHEEKMKEDEEKMKEKEDALRSDITDRDESITALAAEVEKLKALIAGSAPVATSDDGNEYKPSASSRSKIIAEYASEKKISEFSATLRLSKERPELFNNQ